LYRPTRSTDVRTAAVNASTVFAITLAIIAGLIGAWVVRYYFFRPKPVETKKDEKTIPITLMAANVPPDTKIRGLQVRRTRVSKEEYDKFKAEVGDKGEMLTGNQPIGRVAKVALLSERPVYAKEVYDIHYPKPLDLAPGKVALTVEVPGNNMSVRVGDHVDLLCTLSNTDPDIGPTETRTAVMAKNVPVVARFNTTAEGARPTSAMVRSGTRPYTLEVSNYRYGMAELAKQIGGVFTLRPHSKEDSGAGVTVAAKGGQEEDQDRTYVTSDDLVKLFGFTKPLPPRYFEVEKVSGVNPVQGAHIFLEPGSPQPTPKSGSSSGDRRGNSSGPLHGPGTRPGAAPAPQPRRSTGAAARQASLTGTVNSNLSDSGWRHVMIESNSRSASAGNRSVANPNRGGGGLAGSKGTLTASLGGASSRDCPSCGKKR
jgi:Flp pilus assembly protein CpaB